MTSILDETRPFHLNTNKCSTALDSLKSVPSSRWRQNAHSVTPHTHFQFYNSISIIISILNPLLEARACHMNPPFHLCHSFTQIVFPLYYHISLCFYITMFLLLLLFLYPLRRSNDKSFLWSRRSSFLMIVFFFTLFFRCSFSFILPFFDQLHLLSLLFQNLHQPWVCVSSELMWQVMLAAGHVQSEHTLCFTEPRWKPLDSGTGEKTQQYFLTIQKTWWDMAFLFVNAFPKI